MVFQMDELQLIGLEGQLGAARGIWGDGLMGRLSNLTMVLSAVLSDPFIPLLWAHNMRLEQQDTRLK